MSGQNNEIPVFYMILPVSKEKFRQLLICDSKRKDDALAIIINRLTSFGNLMLYSAEPYTFEELLCSKLKDGDWMQLQIKGSDLKIIFSLKVKMNDVEYLRRSYKMQGITHVKFLPCNRSLVKHKPKKVVCRPDKTKVKSKKMTRSESTNIGGECCPNCNCKWFSNKKKRDFEDKNKCTCGRPYPKKKSSLCFLP